MKPAQKTASVPEPDRVDRAATAFAHALRVFESAHAARAWLNNANRSLGGEIPLDLLESDAGFELVMDTLGRIEFGVIS